jgi:hypothetical protein
MLGNARLPHNTVSAAGSYGALLGGVKRAKIAFGEWCSARGSLLPVPPLQILSDSQQPIQTAVKRCCRVNVVVFPQLGTGGQRFRTWLEGMDEFSRPALSWTEDVREALISL